MKERGFSSPACLAHEADPLYMGQLGPDDLPAARAALAACAAGFARLTREAHEPESAGAGALAFEARESVARLRALAARLPERGEEELRLARDLRAAIRAHELLIAAIEQGG